MNDYNTPDQSFGNIRKAVQYNTETLENDVPPRQVLQGTETAASGRAWWDILQPGERK